MLLKRFYTDRDHRGKHSRESPLNVGKESAAITRGGAPPVTQCMVNYVLVLIMSSVIIMISVDYDMCYNIRLSVNCGEL